MGDWGMKVSRAGYDVNTCSDNQLLFSSSFPNPVIDLQGTIRTEGAGTIVAHNYGYVPVYFCSSRPDTFASDVTYKEVFVGTSISRNNSGNINHAYYIMQRDITEVYTASNIATTDASSGTYSADWGFKVSEDGVNVGTAGVADLVSFSGASSAGHAIRHQTIHKSGTASAANGTTTSIAHGLGYKPLFFAWKKQASEYTTSRVRYEVEGEDVVIKESAYCTNTNLVIYNNRGEDFEFAYLIFKDPLI